MSSSRAMPNTGVIPALVVAQLFFSVMVYHSNQSVRAEAEAVAGAGHLASVYGSVLAQLDTVGAAVGGGMFFTLTAGVGLVFLARGHRWGRMRVSGKYSRWYGAATGVAWCAGVVFLNSQGLLWMPTLVAIAVPAIAGLGPTAATQYSPPPGGRLRWLPILAVVAAVVLLAVQGNQTFFRIRDRVLLPNAPGQWAANAYYRYTLYAARVFTPLARRPQVSVFPEISPSDTRASEALTAIAPFGWVSVTDVENATVRLSVADGRMVWRVGRKSIDGGPLNQFIANPKATILKVSQDADTHRPFRIGVLVSLVIASPICLLWVLWASLQWIANRLCPPRWSGELGAVISSALLVLGMVTITWPAPEVVADSFGPGQGAWQQIAALHAAATQTGPMPDAERTHALAVSPTVPVRLALASAMGRRCRRSDGPVLASLLADPEIIVATAAVRAMSRCGGKAAISALAATYRQSDTWYIQNSAFIALKRLRWTPAL